MEETIRSGPVVTAGFVGHAAIFRCGRRAYGEFTEDLFLVIGLRSAQAEFEPENFLRHQHALVSCMVVHGPIAQADPSPMRACHFGSTKLKSCDPFDIFFHSMKLSEHSYDGETIQSHLTAKVQQGSEA